MKFALNFMNFNFMKSLSDNSKICVISVLASNDCFFSFKLRFFWLLV